VLNLGLYETNFTHLRLTLLHSSQTGSETHPPSYPMAAVTLSHGVKRSRRETDHSPKSNAEVK
jgi:hypothetical protein